MVPPTTGKTTPPSVRAVAVCVLGLAVACWGPSVASAKKPASRASACQKLGKRFKDVAASRSLVAVVRGNDDTGRISACVLPRGKVRTLASWLSSSDGGRVVDSAGTWVLVQQSHGDQYYAGGSLTRVDVRRGSTLRLTGYEWPLGSDCPTGTNFGEAAIAPSGAGAVEMIETKCGATTLQAFDTAGALTKLADGAVDALRVNGTRIDWTQGGGSSTAPLPR